MGEEKVEDEEEDDAGGGEDGCRDVEGDVPGLGGPGDAEGEGDDAGEAEANEDARGEELVAPAQVAYKDCAVEEGGGEEEDDEDDADWDVYPHVGDEAQGGHLWGVRRPIQRQLVSGNEFTMSVMGSSFAILNRKGGGIGGLTNRCPNGYECRHSD